MSDKSMTKETRREATWKILRENYVEELCDMIENDKHKTREYEILIEEFSELLKIKRKFAKVDSKEDPKHEMLTVNGFFSDNVYRTFEVTSRMINNIKFSPGIVIYHVIQKKEYVFVGTISDTTFCVVRRTNEKIFEAVHLEFFHHVSISTKIENLFLE